MTEATAPRGIRLPSAETITRDAPLILGLIVMAVPTVAALGSQTWAKESGAHGPIVLATGAWLMSRAWPSFKSLAKEGASWLTALLLVPSLLLYIVGYAYDFISLQGAGLFGAALSALYARVGFPAIRRNWFPILYLGFAVPPPGWVIDRVTAPLKQFVSLASTGVLASAGLPVSRQGVTIFVGPYQLLVEDACSGMNSLVGLIAISLFYIYLLRGSSVRYALVLTGLVIPIAILGNIIRIMILILLTNFFGDAVAQGFLHFTAGLFLFAIDLLLVFACDNLLARILPKAWRPA